MRLAEGRTLLVWIAILRTDFTYLVSLQKIRTPICAFCVWIWAFKWMPPKFASIYAIHRLRTYISELVLGLSSNAAFASAGIMIHHSVFVWRLQNDPVAHKIWWRRSRFLLGNISMYIFHTVFNPQPFNFFMQPHKLKAFRQAPNWCNGACWSNSTRRNIIESSEVLLPKNSTLLSTAWMLIFAPTFQWEIYNLDSFHLHFWHMFLNRP